MSKKKTTEEFIQQAREVHGDKYDYSRVEYVNAVTNVCIICPKHGVFWQRPYIHLRKCGCSRCVNDKRKLWTYETCYEAAKKCCTKSEFKATHQSAYNIALKNKWLGDYTWFVEKHKPNGYWTYETCYEEAKKYTTKSEFEKMARRAYYVSWQNGWMKEYTWLKSKGFRKPRGFWTYEHCYEEAKKYKTRSEFHKASSRAYTIALENNWIKDYTWFVDGRLKMFNGKVDSIYIYKFPDNTVYVGRTLMKCQTKRHIQHTQSRVGEYAKSHNLEMPQMEIVEDRLTLKEGLQRENYWVNWYKEHGYNVLNKAKTGVGSGSLGSILNGKWNRKTCYKEAKKYKTSSEFMRTSAGAYDRARKMGWLRDYIWFVSPQKPSGYWTYEHCYEAAKKCKTRTELYRTFPTAYSKAIQNGWINDYTWFTELHKQRGHWNKFENVKKEAEKYKSRCDFWENNGSAYQAALRNKWMDILFPPKENS